MSPFTFDLFSHLFVFGFSEFADFACISDEFWFLRFCVDHSVLIPFDLRRIGVFLCLCFLFSICMDLRFVILREWLIRSWK